MTTISTTTTKTIRISATVADFEDGVLTIPHGLTGTITSFDIVGQSPDTRGVNRDSGNPGVGLTPSIDATNAYANYVDDINPDGEFIYEVESTSVEIS